MYQLLFQVGTAPFQQLFQRRGRGQAFVVHPVGGDGIVDIGNRHHFTFAANIAAVQAQRIATAINAFMMLGGDLNGQRFDARRLLQ